MTESYTPRVAKDLLAPVIENADIALFELFAAQVRSGGGMTIKDRTFRNCRLEGPVVMLVLGGTTFDACDLGYASGDARNLLFRPVGEKATGAIPFENCKFEGCQFFAVGYTGGEGVITAIAGLPG